MTFPNPSAAGDYLLRSSLLDLLYELRDTDIRLIVGGGYGVYLKQRRVEEISTRTLIPQLPPARSTRDLDLFLRTELLIDNARARRLAAALTHLEYQVVPGRERYQFRKTLELFGQPREIKVDLLTREPAGPERAHLEVERIQVKPKPKAGIHAYRTPEAVAVEDEPTELRVEGYGSSGDLFSAPVLLPHPFAYALLKLFAFRDQKDDAHERRGRGRHHALDLFGLIAMMTEAEYEAAVRLQEKYADNPVVIEAGRIVRECFGDLEGAGFLRLREHEHFTPDLDLRTFLEVLSELFPFR